MIRMEALRWLFARLCWRLALHLAKGLVALGKWIAPRDMDAPPLADFPPEPGYE